jgi:hypothetical protein
VIDLLTRPRAMIEFWKSKHVENSIEKLQVRLKQGLERYTDDYFHCG